MASEFQVEAASLEQLNQLMREITAELNKQAYLAGGLNTTYGGPTANNGSGQAGRAASTPVGNFGQVTRSQEINKIPTNLLKDYRGIKDVLGAQGGLRTNPYGAYRQVSQIREYVGYIAARIAAPNVTGVAVRVLPGGGWATVPQFQTAMVTTSGGGWGAAGTPLPSSVLGSTVTGGGAIAGIAAAALAGFMGYQKLKTLEAENYAGQYNADRMALKTRNDLADVMGGSPSLKVVAALKRDAINTIVEKEKSETRRNTTSMWGGMGYVFEKIGVHHATSRDFANTWVEGNDWGNTLVRGAMNLNRMWQNFSLGLNQPQIKSKQERENQENELVEKNKAEFVTYVEGAQSAAMRGDIQFFKRSHDLAHVGQTTKGYVENIYKDQNAGKIHRIAEENKMASRKFNFTFTEWKKPRDD